MRGFSLIELLVAMAILAIMLGITVANLGGLDNPLNDAAQQVSTALKQSRLKAMSNTNAYRVYPSSTTQLTVQSALNCSAGTWTNETTIDRTLPNGIVFNDTTWSVCFNSRGLAETGAVNIVLVRQSDSRQLLLQVLLGGGVVLPW